MFPLPSFLSLLALPLFSLFISPAKAASCYQPAGNIDTSVVPCNTTINSSACCDPLDSCTTSGLCLGSAGFVYRSACTDSTWTSSNCPQICQEDPLDNTKASTHLDIYHCEVGKFSTIASCGSGSRNNTCAYNFTFPGTGYAFKPGEDVLLSSLSSCSLQATASSQATATVTATATITASASTSDPNSSALSSQKSPANLGLAIGVGVGVPLGVLVIGILAFMVWKEMERATVTKRDRPVEYYDSGTKSWKSGDGEWIQKRDDSRRNAAKRPHYSAAQELGGKGRIPLVEIGG